MIRTDRNHSVSKNESVTNTQSRSLNVEYGYIIDIVSVGEARFFTAMISRERTFRDHLADATVMSLEQTSEELIATYGSPEDLIGLRVRIDYVGNNWTKGIAKVVGSYTPQDIGHSTDIDSRGFRYAIPGRGTV